GVDEEPHDGLDGDKQAVTDDEGVAAADLVGPGAGQGHGDGPDDAGDQGAGPGDDRVHAQFLLGVGAEEGDDQVAGGLLGGEDERALDDLAPVVLEQLGQWGGALGGLVLHGAEHGGLVDEAADGVADDDEDDAEQERDAPAPLEVRLLADDAHDDQHR